MQQRIEANPQDWEARDLLGLRLLQDGDVEGGLEQFLTILQKARDWN
ncbi:tetratricopeptide repeat protein, partial [Rhodanobacter lindaniclasticus]